MTCSDADGCGVMRDYGWMTAFQAEDGGSIPLTRSNDFKDLAETFPASIFQDVPLDALWRKHHAA